MVILDAAVCCADMANLTAVLNLSDWLYVSYPNTFKDLLKSLDITLGVLHGSFSSPFFCCLSGLCLNISLQIIGIYDWKAFVKFVNMFNNLNNLLVFIETCVKFYFVFSNCASSWDVSYRWIFSRFQRSLFCQSSHEELACDVRTEWTAQTSSSSISLEWS